MHPEHQLTDAERRLEALENILLYGGGVASGVASTIGLQTPFGRQLGKAATRGASRWVGKHPVVSLLAMGYAARQAGLSPTETAVMAAEEAVTMMPGTPYWWREQIPIYQEIGETIKSFIPTMRKAAAGERRRMGPPGLASLSFDPRRKRKTSKANRAVKQGMSWLKAGTKAATGAVPGKLPRQAFKTVVRAAGMANPKTKSKPGKGKSIMNKLARRLKKWW